MKHPSFIFALLVLFAVPFGAFAQSDASGVVTSLLPNVYVQALTVQTDQNHITGSFIAQNEDSSAISNLHYEASILDPLPETKPGEIAPDDSIVYSHIVNNTPINLAPQESKTIPIDLQIPALPDKDYRLQVRLVTSNNRQLGWSDAAVHLSGSSDFIVGDATSIDVASVDPVTKEKSSTWEPMTGPNVDPHAKIVLVEHIKHVGTSTISVIPRLVDTRILIQSSEPIIQTLPAISLKAGEDTTLQFPIVASDIAGSHQIILTFLQGNNPISTESEFRYVVRGASAAIGQQSVESMPGSKGSSALVHFVVSASADRATWTNLTNVVTITDPKGTVGSVTNTLKADHSTPGNATVVLDRAICGTPTVTISLIAADGKTIDTNTAEYPQFTSTAGCDVSTSQPSQAPSSPTNYTKLFIVGLILILVLVVGFIVYLVRGKNKATGVKTLMMLIVTVGSGLGIYMSSFHSVQANGIQYEIGIAAPQVLISLFVNSPKHNSAVSVGPVSYSGDFSWYDCDNTVRLGTIQVLVKQGSWKASLPRPLGKEWQKIASSSTQYYSGGKSHSWRHTQFNGKLTIPSSAVDGQGYTTLWTVGYASGFNGFGLPPDFRLPVPDDHGLYASLCQKPYNPAIAIECVADTYDAFGIMFDLTSVHFPVTPTITPTITPTPTSTPKITPTPTPTPKITPTPTPKPTPTPTPVSGNHPPVSVATMSVNGGAFSSSITVVQGTQVIIRLSANGSSDPDGWTTPATGVSNGGKCDWNSDLNQGVPTFDTTIVNPSSSAACQISLGNLTFNDAPGTYTYSLLRITDDAGAQSNTGKSSVTILPKGSITPTPVPPTPTPTPIFNSGTFNETR